LQQANRKLKWAVFTALFAVVAGVVAGCAWHSGTVEADRFVLRDKQGRLRVEMAMSYDFGPNGNPVIRLLDEKGQARTVLSAGVLTVIGEKAGASATLLADSLQFDATGPSSVTARLSGEKEGGELWLMGNGGNVFLRSNPPVIELSDDAGFLADLGRTILTVTGTGETRQRSAASLVFSSKDGKVLWSAP